MLRCIPFLLAKESAIFVSIGNEHRTVGCTSSFLIRKGDGGEERESLREIKVVKEREMCKEGDGGDGYS